MTKDETIIHAVCHTPMEVIWRYGDDYIGHLKEELSRRMAEGVLDILSREPSIAILKQDLKSFPDFNRDEAYYYKASLEWKPLVKCKECIHRPQPPAPDATVPLIRFPDNTCPCTICPSDDFFCANGEREEKTDEAD